MPPAAWVQGDDYAGGNPPFPNYVNTAAFDAWYTSSGTYRRFYDISYASAGVDHIIDSSVQFNGHNTLRMDFGAGHFGAGWDSLLSCLLYTSDAADERSSVDLGGRRI